MNLVNYFLSAFLSAFAWISGPLHLSSQTAPVPPVAESPSPSPSAVLGESDTLGTVLASHTEGPVFFNVNIPSIFNDVVTFKKDIIAPNLVSSLLEGSGIDISSGASPKITNTGVLSLQGSTGALSLVAGDGISLDGLKITNSDRGSSQNIFKNIKVGSTSFSAGSNTDTLEFAGSGATTVSIDTTNKKITVSSSAPDFSQSGWTRDSTLGYVYLTTSTDKVGIGTSAPSTPLHVVGASTLAGAVTLGSSTSDALTFTGRMANGTSLLPDTDLGSDLGSSAKRFNNLWVANINSNSSQSFSGQTTFSYAPTDATVSQASVFINPTTSAANGQLLAFGIAGYQRALIDADGDLIIGYNNLTSAPVTSYPLTIYGHSGTNVSFVDTSGNSYFAGNMGVGVTGSSNKFEVRGTGTPLRIARSTDNLQLMSIDSSNGYTHMYAADLSGGSEASKLTFLNNAVQLYRTTDHALRIDSYDSHRFYNSQTTSELMRITSSGNVGIGTTNPGAKLEIAGGAASAPYEWNALTLSQSNGEANELTTLLFKDSLYPTGTSAIKHKLYSGGTSSELQFHTSSTGTSSQKMVILNSGNVGIGTTAPAGALVVASSTTTDRSLSIQNSSTGYASSDGFNFSIDALGGGYVWNKENQPLYFGTNSTTRMTILNAGNVGIGTTNPGYNLEISGTGNRSLILWNTTGGNPSYIYNLASTTESTTSYAISEFGGTGSYPITVGVKTVLGYFIRKNTDYYLNIINGGNVGIGTTAPTSKLHLTGAVTGKALAIFDETGDQALFTASASGVTKFVIDHSGNVGIGTTSPGALLHVHATGATPILMKLTNTGIIVGGNTNALLWQPYNASDGSNIINLAHSSLGAIKFTKGQSQDPAVNTELMRITNAGNVGIGTTAPGTINGTDYSSGRKILHLSTNGIGSMVIEGTTSELFMNDSDGTAGARLFQITNGAGVTKFKSLNDSSSTHFELMAFDLATGNVGIGTTSPSSLLHVRQSGYTTPATQSTYGLTVSNNVFSGLSMGSDASYAYIQSWDSKPLIVNNQGNNTLFNILGGNVGIGTTSPSYKIEVNGQFRMVANESTVNLGEIIAGTEGIAIKGSYSSQLYLGYPTASGGAGGGRFALYTTNDMFFGGNNVDANLTAGKDWIFKTGGYRQGNEGTEKLRITSAGLVGIGTTAPTSILHVSGAVVGKALGIFDETGNQALLTASASGVTKLTINHNGLVDATAGGLATYTKAGTISDTDFADTAVDGLLGVDSTNDRLYVRNSSGVWNYIAFTGGFQIPDYESQDLKPGDLLLPYVESILSDGAAHGMYRKFSLKNLIENEEGLTFRGDTSFRGPIFFYKLAEFIDHVIFRNAPTFPSNMGGIAVIPQNSSSVDVVFNKSFAYKPVVTTSLISDTTISNQSYPDTVITNISETGFTISLSQLSPSEIKFNWIALAIDNPGTVMGKSTPTESPTPTGSPTPTAAPDPTTTPSLTPSPTPTPDVTPVATVSAEPTPNSPESTESAQL